MKLIPGCCFIFLLLSVLIPMETEALGPFVLFRLQQLAVRQGLKLGQMSHYAKCGTVGVPPGMKCPKNVFGIGKNQGQAKFTATIYATMFGYKECDNYIGECFVFDFKKGKRKPMKTEALGPFVLFRLQQLAVRQGLKLGQMSHYAKCGTVGVPPGMKCPKNVFGIGKNQGQAKFTATIYATMFGYKECDNYIGECFVFDFKKGKKIPGVVGK